MFSDKKLDGMPPFDPSKMFGGGAPHFEMPPLVDVSHLKNSFLDVEYADMSPNQKLDVFLPETGEGPFPLIIHIHGGGFALGDKRDGHIRKLLELLDLGYAFATINYRLSHEAIFPAAITDCKAAVKHIRANADGYKIDVNRIGVIGGSAGGNLSAILALTPDNDELYDIKLGYEGIRCDVCAAVDWFGPTDFTVMDDQAAENGFGMNNHNNPESPESSYMGGAIPTLEKDYVQKANPITYINDKMPPMLIQHGDKDHLVPIQQSIIFAEAIESKLGKGRAEFVILHGADHEDPLFETDENMEKVIDFFNKYLKSKEI